MKRFIYLVALVILISSCGNNKNQEEEKIIKQEVEVLSKQIVSENIVDDKNKQNGYKINSDIKSRINEPLSLQNDIIAFISKAKYIKTEVWTDTICSKPYKSNYAIYKHNGKEFYVSQYDDGGFGISTINNENKFIELNVDNNDFWFRNTASKDQDYPIKRVWTTNGNLSCRIYATYGQGSQLDLDATINEIETTVSMWKKLLNN